jgi:hypothetical protein
MVRETIDTTVEDSAGGWNRLQAQILTLLMIHLLHERGYWRSDDERSEYALLPYSNFMYLTVSSRFTDITDRIQRPMFVFN